MFYISAKKSVVDKDEEEDDLPDSYDYKDSFIDDNTQKESCSEAESDDESSEDIHRLKKDAKKFVKNKKLYQK
jgi:hypothetical protein